MTEKKTIEVETFYYAVVKGVFVYVAENWKLVVESLSTKDSPSLLDPTTWEVKYVARTVGMDVCPYFPVAVSFYRIADFIESGEDLPVNRNLIEPEHVLAVGDVVVVRRLEDGRELLLAVLSIPSLGREK